VLDFSDFIATYPRHPLAVNAQYWIAEAYYAQRDYRQASLEFQKVLQYGGMQAKAADDLRRMVTDKLVAEGLVYEGAKAFATARGNAAASTRAPASCASAGACGPPCRRPRPR